MQFGTRFTLDFVERSLPGKGRRVLEVGCGSGELAASLAQNQFAVVAIDCDPDAVAGAQQLGVDARVATWPDFDGGRFDAVLFTRSLHHIHPLVKALKQAADSLLPRGRLIVEDFAYEAVDDATLRWFGAAIQALDRRNLLIKDNEFLNALRLNTETLSAWRANHERELHTAANISGQINGVFAKVTREDVPYFFRYLTNTIVPGANRYRIVEKFAEEEAAMISEGTIIALGRRFVATKKIVLE